MTSVKNKRLYDCSLTALDHCRQSLNKIERIKDLNAFITVLKDDALRAAEESDKRIRQGCLKSNLDGLTIAVKDNFCTEGVKTTCASKMLDNFKAPYDATVVRKLKNAGAIIIGKTNMDEFAMGSGTVDSIFGATKNIWGSSSHPSLSSDKTTGCHIAGGSSGGSAVAVATGVCFAALGSDTGGSTRNPAAYCGVVGYKPTYGIVSRHGLIPLVNSMDVPGIIGRKVEDVTDVFNAISGLDSYDSTTVSDCIQPVNVSLPLDIKNVCIGVPKEYHAPNMSSEILETWKEIQKVFKEAGARVKEVSLPHTEHSIATYSILNACEVASNMSRYSGILFGHRSEVNDSTEQLIAESRSQAFGDVVQSRILAGNYFLLNRNYDKYFVQAMKVRRLIANDFNNVWSSGINFLLTPVTLSTAPLLEEFTKLDNRSQCATQDYCTQPVNMAGCAAISLPIKLSTNGLPISLQMIGANFNDAALLCVAKWLQDAVAFPHLMM